MERRSFFSSLFSLASLPSIPSLALPSSLQTRLVSFLLRRSLGRYLKSQIDLDSLTSDLSNGKAELRGVLLDEEVINPLLLGTHLSLKVGSISAISAQLNFPAINVVVEDVVVVLVPAPPPPVNIRTEPPQPPSDPAGDLEASVLSVAEQFVHEQEESFSPEDEADDPLHSLHLVPGAFLTPTYSSKEEGDVEDVSATSEKQNVTILASVIARILARLGVSIRSVVVRLELANGTSIEMRASGLSYGETQVKVDGAEVWIAPRVESPSTPLPPTSKSLAPPRASSLSEDDSSSSDEDDITENDDMMMSQSIADLRSSVDSASFYASASSRSAFPLAAPYEESSETPESVSVDPFSNPDLSAERDIHVDLPRSDQTHRLPPFASSKYPSETAIPSSDAEDNASPPSPSTSLEHRILTLGSPALFIRLVSPTETLVSLPSDIHLTLFGTQDLATLSQVVSSVTRNSDSHVVPPESPAAAARMRLCVEVESIQVSLLLSAWHQDGVFETALTSTISRVTATESEVKVGLISVGLRIPLGTEVMLQTIDSHEEGESKTSTALLLNLDSNDVTLCRPLTLSASFQLVEILYPFILSLRDVLSPPASLGYYDDDVASITDSIATLPARVDLLSDLESPTSSAKRVGWSFSSDKPIRLMVRNMSGEISIDLGGVRTAISPFGWAGGVQELQVNWASADRSRSDGFLVLGFPPSAIPAASSPALQISAEGVRIGSLTLTLDRPTVAGLQYWVDELARWSSSLPPSKGRNVQTESLAEDIDGAPRRSCWVEEIEIHLLLPSEEVEEVRPLSIRISDLELALDQPDTELSVQFADISISRANTALVSRTLDRNRSIPVLAVKYTLSESKAEVALTNLTISGHREVVDWVQEVVDFVKAPEGTFTGVPPSDRTLVRLSLNDVSFHVQPPTLSSAVVVSFEHFEASADIIRDAPMCATLLANRVRVLAVESDDDLRDGGATTSTAFAHWKSKGYVSIAEVEKANVELQKAVDGALPDVVASLSDTKVIASVCADTLPALTALASDFAASFAKPLSSTSSPTATASTKRFPNKKPSADLLSSVDPRAFQHAPSLEDMPEYLDDDVPSNEHYLADALSDHHATQANPLRLRDVQAGQVISDIDGETIRMLDPRGLRIIDGYLTKSGPEPSPTSSKTIASTRIKVTGLEIVVHIHEGFDWASTRRAIEEEAKRVRRRLEKIRQLLASGQAADASGEDASVLLFGSVQLGLPPGAVDLPAGQLLDAINEELEERSEAESTVESWQSLSGQPSPRRQMAVGKSRKRLTRSSSYAIEVNLRNVTSSFESYPDPSSTASHLRVDVDSFDIIDNIRTSTWRKFLTELRSSDGGLVRESGAAMLRFEMQKVRSEEMGRSVSAQEEILMKIKIFPLRLYIDQDALDFLKIFGAFRVPRTPDPGKDTQPAQEPFFQRVEILPVRIKLDYKPKRVDYHALRLGKTAELMNFFHFDGSEMTLRHLVVSGVSGSTRLSELVQDIWTPDVKSNQLADVIAGIAPVRSVVNLGSGVANLVLLPIEQYRKDGRLARGLQRGVTSFSRNTTLEALNVGARLATGTQVILEQAESVLGARLHHPVTAETASAASGEQSILELSEEEHQELISRYAQQPSDLREGVESAYRSLGDNFRSAAQTILAVPMEVYERSGTEGPVRAVVRAVPIAVLKPMIGASEAVSKVLFGLRNSLDPDAQAEAADKFKSRTSSN